MFILPNYGFWSLKNHIWLQDRQFCVFTFFFAYFWLFFGQWRTIESNYDPKNTPDVYIQNENGLYYQSMHFSHLEIIFGLKLWDFVFCPPPFCRLRLFFSQWMPIEFNYALKYTSDRIFYEANGSHYQIVDLGDLEIIFGFKLCNFLFSTPFSPY